MCKDLLKEFNDREPDPEFRAFVESMPDGYWAKYDLSAVRLGWEARKIKEQEKQQELAEVVSEAIDTWRNLNLPMTATEVNLRQALYKYEFRRKS